jgi:hypothetical protein
VEAKTSKKASSGEVEERLTPKINGRCRSYHAQVHGIVWIDHSGNSHDWLNTGLRQSPMGSVGSVVLQAVQVLVALPAVFASVRLLLLHAHSAWIGGGSFWVKNRESSISVVMELLVSMSVLKEMSVNLSNVKQE